MSKPSGLQLATSVIVVAGVDLASKAAAPALAERTSLVVAPVGNSALSLQLVDLARWTEVAVMAAVLLGLAVLGLRLVVRGLLPVWAAALVLGGSLGNLVDRAVLGAVRDFLLVGQVVLNLADVAVAAGLAVTVLCLWPRQAGDHPELRVAEQPPAAPLYPVGRG